jgi:hypothetical protein
MPWVVPDDDDASPELVKKKPNETPAEKAARESEEEPEPYDEPKMMSYEEIKRLYPNSLPQPITNLPPIVPALPVSPVRPARTEVDKAREERIRRASNGGTRIPTQIECGTQEKQMTQADYDRRKREMDAEYLKMAAESGVSLQKPLHGCENCRPGKRDVNGTCCGWCMSPYTWGNT